VRGAGRGSDGLIVLPGGGHGTASILLQRSAESDCCAASPLDTRAWATRLVFRQGVLLGSLGQWMVMARMTARRRLIFRDLLACTISSRRSTPNPVQQIIEPISWCSAIHCATEQRAKTPKCSQREDPAPEKGETAVAVRRVVADAGTMSRRTNPTSPYTPPHHALNPNPHASSSSL
jgi:hypothetical protein